MLTHLSIQNFTLVEHLDLDLKAGMTVITGETGAGKSILLEALGQTLGDRADATRVRQGTAQADISTNFHIAANNRAAHWLEQHDLAQDNLNECLLRRVITSEGRSKAYINGHPVTLTQLRTLGEMLMDIHSQHEHQSLLVKDNHKHMLDEYSGQRSLTKQVKTAFYAWQKMLEQLKTRQANDHEITARQQLLSYQVEELDLLSLEACELEKLEQEQCTLANAENILQSTQQLTDLCSDGEQGLQTSLQQALNILQSLESKPTALLETEKLLNNAQIHVQEAQSELNHYAASFSIDPARLQLVEARLSSIYEIARKHRIQAQKLPEFHRQLAQELTQLAGGDEQLEQLEQEALALETHFRKQAGVLSKKRHAASIKFARKINKHLSELAMEHAKLSVDLKDRTTTPAAHGLEDIEFLISTNPGQPPLPLSKVASGGELSRISLAIQVVSAETCAIPSLVFDEVDVGIGGATADTVGQLLRQLAQNAQILCVTHLPQVASKGHQHLQVKKAIHGKSAQTALVELNKQEKVDEIARMLGGTHLTTQSLAHAEQILACA